MLLREAKVSYMEGELMQMDLARLEAACAAARALGLEDNAPVKLKANAGGVDPSSVVVMQQAYDIKKGEVEIIDGVATELVAPCLTFEL